MPLSSHVPLAAAWMLLIHLRSCFVISGLNFLIHLLLLLFVEQLKPPGNKNAWNYILTQLESPCLGGFGIAASQETQTMRKAGVVFHGFTLFPHPALTFLILKKKKKKKGF